VEGITSTAQEWLAQAGTSQNSAAKALLERRGAAVNQIQIPVCINAISVNGFSFSLLSKDAEKNRITHFFFVRRNFF